MCFKIFVGAKPADISCNDQSMPLETPARALTNNCHYLSVKMPVRFNCGYKNFEPVMKRDQKDSAIVADFQVGCIAGFQTRPALTSPKGPTWKSATHLVWKPALQLNPIAQLSPGVDGYTAVREDAHRCYEL
jgi:hypothetical protein